MKTIETSIPVRDGSESFLCKFRQVTNHTWHFKSSQVTFGPVTSQAESVINRCNFKSAHKSLGPATSQTTTNHLITRKVNL